MKTNHFGELAQQQRYIQSINFNNSKDSFLTSVANNHYSGINRARVLAAERLRGGSSVVEVLERLGQSGT